MPGEEEAVSRLTAELGKLFLDRFGKEPDPQVVREEAENLVSRYGPIRALKDILGNENE
jgi:hypothetical protein